MIEYILIINLKMVRGTGLGTGTVNHTPSNASAYSANSQINGFIIPIKRVLSIKINIFCEMF